MVSPWLASPHGRKSHPPQQLADDNSPQGGGGLRLEVPTTSERNSG